MNDKEKYFQIFGETKCIKDWYKDQRMTSDIGYTTLVNRLNSGMDPKIAISKPSAKTNTRYGYNHDYFASWNLENAWIIGYITADGCIEKGKSVLKFHISHKDICILKHIQKLICPQKPIRTYTRLKPNGTTTKICRFDICSKNIVIDLNKYNIYPQKTGKEILPDFPNMDIAYRYLSGLIDGDGTVGFYKVPGYENYYRYAISIVSANMGFLENIQSYFDFPKTKITINYNKFRQPTYYNLNITDKKTIVQLYHNLYKNNLFALKRKKDQFKKIIRYIEKKANP